MTLSEYFAANDSAIRGNPPSQSPAYQTDPKAMWRYYMRNFGAGLAEFDLKETENLITGLYSGWFMRLEFANMKRPDVDAKEFFSWIRSARDEWAKKTKNVHPTQQPPAAK